MMSDYYPEVARGARTADGVPAPPRPDEDERWEYVADHLRAIRGSLGFLAFVAFMQVCAVVLALLMWALQDNGGGGY